MFLLQLHIIPEGLFFSASSGVNTLDVKENTVSSVLSIVLVNLSYKCYIISCLPYIMVLESELVGENLCFIVIYCLVINTLYLFVSALFLWLNSFQCNRNKTYNILNHNLLRNVPKKSDMVVCAWVGRMFCSTPCMHRFWSCSGLLCQVSSKTSLVCPSLILSSLNLTKKSICSQS